jgi:site-specific DNA-methyltransferase (adenine-specific)
MISPYFEKNKITIYHGDLLDVLPQLPEASIDCVVTDPPYSLSFMGKEWDKKIPGPEYWQAVVRVCKPGAMMLAFGGTRTFHRLTCAIEDAGWEIRDCLMWLYGQGFPKSMDISKSIDKMARAERRVVGKYQPPGMDKPWNLRNAKDERTVDVFASSRNNLGITAPATASAKQWQGWGTALKPAWEPIILAMKPLDGPFTANAKKHDVAGLNIDACRIPCTNSMSSVTGRLGRWPTNLLLDEEAATQLDEQTGTLSSGTNCIRRKEGAFLEHGGLGKAGDLQVTYGDSGGASRFFYCGKATKKERGTGNNHPCVKPVELMKYLLTLLSTPTGGVILDPFAGSGTTAMAAKQLGRRCICVELDKHYCDIATTRLER